MILRGFQLVLLVVSLLVSTAGSAVPRPTPVPVIVQASGALLLVPSKEALEPQEEMDLTISIINTSSDVGASGVPLEAKLTGAVTVRLSCPGADCEVHPGLVFVAVGANGCVLSGPGITCSTDGTNVIVDVGAGFVVPAASTVRLATIHLRRLGDSLSSGGIVADTGVGTWQSCAPSNRCVSGGLLGATAVLEDARLIDCPANCFASIRFFPVLNRFEFNGVVRFNRSLALSAPFGVTLKNANGTIFAGALPAERFGSSDGGGLLFRDPQTARASGGFAFVQLRPIAGSGSGPGSPETFKLKVELYFRDGEALATEPKMELRIFVAGDVFPSGSEWQPRFTRAGRIGWDLDLN